MNLAAGTVLQNGKYVVEAILGQGGFGITYRAHHAYFDQPVVIKVLHENLRRHADFAQFQQQFIAEARRVARCQHPNIVRVFDFFEEGGLSFIVMDYIPGDTLADIVQAEGALPEAKAIHYIRQIGAALNVVHQAGLLHRDVKPHNIIRREHTDFVILIDFGIAREFTPGVTQTHTGMLSAGYAPIEQYLPQGKRTPAIDIYALAATLYSLVTGQAPIAAPLRDRIPLLDMRQFQPRLSAVVEQAILCGMEMEAEARPQTVAEWLALLPNSNFVTPPIEAANGSKLPPVPPPSAYPQSRSQSTPATVTSATLPVVPRHNPAPAAVAPAVATPTSATVVAANGASATPAPPRKASPPPALTRSPFPKALLGAAAIATCIGAAFGLALRMSGGQAGPTFLHNDQSFPPKAMPGSEVPTSIPSDAPVEQVAPPERTAPEPSEPTADWAPIEPAAPPIEPNPSPAPDIEDSTSPVEPVVPPDSAPNPVPVEASPIPAPAPVVEPEPQPPAGSAEPAPEPAPPSDNSTAPSSSFAPPDPPEPPAPSL